MEEAKTTFMYMATYPPLKYALCAVSVLLLVFLIKYVSRVLQWGTEKVLTKKNYVAKSWLNLIIKYKLPSGIFFAIGLAFLTPAARVILPEDYPDFTNVFLRTLGAFVVISVMICADSFLRIVSDKFSRSTKLPLKGLTQAVQIVLWVLTGLLVIATLINKDPALLLGGLTALSAVTMLVFKDSIMGLVSGIQLSFNDLVRVGDWIEIPSKGADGDVVDITLTTILVRNWDNTIVSVPAYDLVSNSFKNWRGMTESGGRRIKRSIKIDLTTVRFLELADIRRLKKINLIRDYLDKKEKDIIESKAKLEGNADNYNVRRLSNIGTFRRYCYEYLKQNPDISDRFTCMVRQLEPTSEGIPLEIYAFSSNTNWVAYEDIQSDIFDHLLSIITAFDLKVYQHYGDRPLK
jgi:miniconductance mechanosensitive channel